MATLFNMYKDVASPDVTSDIRESRRESETNTKKTQDTAFGMLKRSNVGTLQQEYRAGSGRFKDITDPDKKFQVYYDALKALDPQAAQDAGKIYAEERQRKINADVADAYKGEGGDPELQALENAIKDLRSSIASDEASAKNMEVEQQKQAEQQQEQAKLQEQAETKATDNMDLSREDLATVGAIPLPRESRDMKGYTPSLTNYYSTDKKMPLNDISLSTEETMIDDSMEGYIPMSRYDSYSPTARSLASMYRGR